MLNNLKTDLKKLADPQKAKFYPRFFKTGSGQYGEGDKFIGVTVPDNRIIAKRYGNLDFNDLKKLIRSPIHEERLCALLILVNQFKKAETTTQEKIYNFYFANTKYINNWDLVDLSSDQIVGAYLVNKPKDVLIQLAKSPNIWGRRIAIIATFNFIKQKDATWTIRIAHMLLTDNHDLIHKAVGWMLREVGKRCDKKTLIDFLNQYAHMMPRTMLRYAIEHFGENERQKYLRAKAKP